MKRRKISCTLLIFSIFLFSELIIYSEAKLEHKPESIEEDNILKNKDFDMVRMIVVDQTNGNSKYTTIQQAINDAEAGTTVYVKAGTYREILNVYKPINIIGEDKEITVIFPCSNKNGYAVKISSPQVSLNKLSISNNGPGLYTTGIKIVAPEAEIIDCNVFDTPVGIATWSSSNIISQCSFYGCEDEGIVFLGTENSICSNNLVTNCEFFNNCDGIELQYSKENVISNCNFYQNTHAGIDAIGSFNNGNIIDNCSFNENDVFAIYLSRSLEITITSCIVKENQIMLNNVEDTKINKCEIENLYLLNSKIEINSCNNFKISQVKNVNSECLIDNINQENDRNSIFYTLLEYIKLRLIILRENLLNK